MVVELLSDRQIETVFSIGKVKLDIHCGPYGCGKTYSIALGLGLACQATTPPRDGGCITLVGKTAKSVKANVCNYLASFFGDNFYYDSGKKDGYDKDAMLFGHMIRIVGLNDAGAEARIRGLSTYLIVGDELSTWSSENYDKMFGRLRGQTPEGWMLGFVGSTNPDSPIHWLWKKIKPSKDEKPSNINYIAWTKDDNITSGAPKYYADLIAQYANNPAYMARYVEGKWSAAEGLVYKEFHHNRHVLEQSEVDRLLEIGAFRSFTLGVDFGTSKCTAILLIGVTEDHENVVISEVYMTKDINITKVVNEIRDLVIEYNNRLKYIYVDPAANVLITQLKVERMLNVIGGDNSVMNGIDYVKDLFITDKLFISSSCKNLIAELYTYKYSDKDGVNVVKENDHAVDALRYGVYTGSQVIYR
jgi:PBSX family phage terminase large subunit